jgi:hypothetical protein
MNALQIENTKIYQDTLRLPRYADHDRLLKYGARVYSQCDEDGIIAEIFKRIGVTNRTFVEIGTGDGTQCNTVALLVDGWRGLWIEGMQENFEKIEHNICPLFPALKAIGCLVDAENINDLITGNMDREVDLLSIDIDGNDFWVWHALTAINPRVICIEYNALLPPPVSRVVPYDPEWKWDGTHYYGASLEAMCRLGQTKGYSLVGCSFAGSNAFFVRDDVLVEEWQSSYKPLFKKPFTAEEHYEPIRFFAALSVGHAARPAPWAYVDNNFKVSSPFQIMPEPIS